ncbi:hypothetical protein Prum_090030 [Phytohabitans rumicis]|uniref:Uncharacterized protein n=1 Tax=Phytohabitans rumicis TaxID=1076125 RepID=A0A6V8LK93_9ACTN|nr:hypothetical protein Prum_090030 [Phytohabitans rumicis]
MKDGETFIEVLISDSTPIDADARVRWLMRAVGHEVSEDHAVRSEGFVARQKARLRGKAGRPERPAHRDALGHGADPRLDRLSPHDEGHRAEVRILLKLLSTDAAAKEAIEVELGLLLDELGITHPDAADPDRRHGGHRLELLNLAGLNLTADELKALDPFLEENPDWRSDERRLSHLAATGEVGTVRLGDGTTVPVRVSKGTRAGRGFRVEPATPRMVDGIPVRDADGRVVMEPAKIIFDKGAQILKVARRALTRLALETEPSVFGPRPPAPKRVREAARLAAALAAATPAIQEGLDKVGAELLGPHPADERPTVRIRTGIGDIAMELQFGALPDGQAYRVEVATPLGAETELRARVIITNAKGMTRALIAAAIAEAVTQGVLTLREYGPVGLLAAVEQVLRAGKLDQRAVEALLATAAQAARIGQPDHVVRFLAAAQVLTDQGGSHQRVKALRRWLAEMGHPDLLSRMFDTRSKADPDEVLSFLQMALDMAAERFTPSSVSGALIRDGELRVEIGGKLHHLPIKVVESGQREFAVRLVADPDVDGGYRVEVREDASAPVLQIEAAGVLAEFASLMAHVESGEALDEPAKRRANGAAHRARVEALAVYYRMANKGQRLLIERYVQATTPVGSGRVLLRLRESTGSGRFRAGKPLTADRPDVRVHGHHMYRRIVQTFGSAGNTLSVGPEFGRDPVGMWTSVLSGLAGNVFQGNADARLGKPLSHTRLMDNPSAELAKTPDEPPGPSKGDPFSDNLNKRVPAAVSASLVALAVQLAGGDVAKAGLGGSVTFLASITQAVADKLADPLEFTAVDNRKDLEKAEPDTARNRLAENLLHRIWRLNEAEGTPGQQTLDELESSLDGIDKAIEGAQAEVDSKLAELRWRHGLTPQLVRTLWNNTGGKVTRWRFAPPPSGPTYDLGLPKATARPFANPLRVGFQQGVMQVPSLVLGFFTTPALLIANMWMQVGRGLGYGYEWTSLSARQADDASAVAAARALAQLRLARAMILQMLNEGDARPRLTDPDAQLRSALAQIMRQIQTDRARGIPRDESNRSQARKHVLGFIGGVILAKLFVPDIPAGPTQPAGEGGNDLVWLAGQLIYTAFYIVGEGAMRLVNPILKQIDADAQLRAQADRLPLADQEIAADVRALSERIGQVTDQIKPRPRPAPDVPGGPMAKTGRSLIRTALAGGRLVRGHVALRPGDNPVGRVWLGRVDGRAVDRLVKHVRILARVAALAATNDRVPVGLAPAIMRPYVHRQLELLGLLTEQAGASARWTAVVNDVKTRYGIDLDTYTEVTNLRGNPAQNPIVKALDVMVRNGWSTSNPNVPAASAICAPSAPTAYA